MPVIILLISSHELLRCSNESLLYLLFAIYHSLFFQIRTNYFGCAK